MKKPHLLILMPGFPADEQDSITVPYIQDWILEAKAFFEIQVISFQYPFEEKNNEWKGVKVYSAGGKNKSFPLRLWTWRKVWKKMNDCHSISSIDIVLCFWLTEPSLLGEYFCRKNPSVKLVRWALGQDVKPENLYLKILDLTKGKLLFLSNRYPEIMGKNASLLRLGLPSFVSKLPFPPQRKIDIIGIGSHIPLKRYGIFLKTIALLKTDFPQLNCVLIGNGQETTHLQMMAEQLHLLENVQFIPFLPREKIFESLAESKILFHTSEYEGQGMVLTEALQMGCYLVAREVGNVPQTAKAFICQDDAQFLGVIKGILSQEKWDFSPFEMPSMRETVEIFCKLIC